MAKALKNVFKNSNKIEAKASDDRFEWVKAHRGHIPDGALIGGEDINGEPMFVCRARHTVPTPGAERTKKKRPDTLHTLPGKLVPSHEVAYVAFKGHEYACQHYEVLVEKPEMYWQQWSSGCDWQNAVVGALTPVGQQLFIGRTQHNTETLVCGYVDKDNAELHIPFDGREFTTRNFEYLCCEK